MGTSRRMAPVDAGAMTPLESQISDDWLANFFDTFDTTITGDAVEFALGATETAIGAELGLELCEASEFAEEAGENGKRGRATESTTTTTTTTTLSEGAKRNKSKREKLRRDALNDKFMALSAVLEPGSVPKTDKAKVVVAATALIKKLRDHHNRLTEMIIRMQAEKTRQQEMNAQLVQEKTQLLHEKLRIEAQLQTYLTSMPFASPAGGVVTGASGKAAVVPAPVWAFPTPFLEQPTTEEEDVTLRAPVA